jgi:uncharacterized protein
VIVLDSSFLIAFHNSRDVHHAQAGPAMDRLLDGEWGRGLLPEYVFLEVVTVLAARVGLRVAVEVGDAMLQAPELEFIPCSDVFLDAFSIFRRQTARTLSFADAAVVAVARRGGAHHIATFDSDFYGLEDLTVVPSEGAG